jgi:hypothetical protein
VNTVEDQGRHVPDFRGLFVVAQDNALKSAKPPRHLPHKGRIQVVAGRPPTFVWVGMNRCEPPVSDRGDRLASDPVANDAGHSVRVEGTLPAAT